MNSVCAFVWATKALAKLKPCGSLERHAANPSTKLNVGSVLPDTTFLVILFASIWLNLSVLSTSSNVSVMGFYGFSAFEISKKSSNLISFAFLVAYPTNDDLMFWWIDHDDTGTFNTERLSIKPWDEEALTSKMRDNRLLDEISDMLDADMTAFFPEKLWYKEGTMNVAEWAETFGKGSTISTVWLGTGELTGLLMIRRPEDTNSYMHIGYLFGKAHWGKGLATELLRGLVRNLKTKEYTGMLHAGVVHGNPASARVLKKVFTEMEDKSKASDVDWFQLQLTKETSWTFFSFAIHGCLDNCLLLDEVTVSGKSACSWSTCAKRGIDPLIRTLPKSLSCTAAH